MVRDPDEPTAKERMELRSLPHEMMVPEDLEPRVLDALNKRGLLSGRGRWWRAPTPGVVALAVAACLTTLVLGIGIGRDSVRNGGTAQPQFPRASFILFLHAGPEFEPLSEENFPGRFSDYNTWVGEARRAGHFITGEQLDESGRIVLPTSGDPVVAERLATGDDGVLISMFMIRAEDYDEATSIAMSLPHLRYGGRVVVRRVDPI